MPHEQTTPFNGIIAVDKPAGITSHDVIDRIRGITGVKKVGHAGTLDPLATGVLVIAVGRKYTRQLTELIKKDKQYRAEIILGATSDTDDAEGNLEERHCEIKPKPADVERVLKTLTGTVNQTPPIYSSIKIKGRPAHRLARSGKQVRLEPRVVKIDNIMVLEYDFPRLEIQVDCGSGVYIRSLARDIGEKLGTGGYLKNLRRTRVGDFNIEKALKIDEFAEIIRESEFSGKT